MGDQGSDAIKIWVGIILTLFIVGILFGVVMIGSRGTNSSTAKISETATALSEGEFTSYNGQVVNGDQVLGIIQQFQGKQCGIFVKTKKDSSGTCYIGELDGVDVDKATASLNEVLANGEQSKRVATAQDRTKEQFLGSSAKFTGTVLRDPDTNQVTGLAFVQETATE